MLQLQNIRFVNNFLMYNRATKKNYSRRHFAATAKQTDFLENLRVRPFFWEACQKKSNDRQDVKQAKK